MHGKVLNYGIDTPTCVNCLAALERFPGRTINCKRCGGRINRVKRPWDGRIVLIRDSELLLHDEQKALAFGYHAQWVTDRARDAAEAERERRTGTALQRTLGRPLTDEELAIALVHDELDQHFRKRNWDEYAWSMDDLANIYFAANQPWHYLDCMFDSLYVKANGWCSVAAEHGADDLFPLWNYTQPHPGIEASRMLLTLQSLGVQPQLAEFRFCERAARYRSMGMPFDPRRVWADVFRYLVNTQQIAQRPSRQRRQR